jgi:hypothetical protein
MTRTDIGWIGYRIGYKSDYIMDDKIMILAFVLYKFDFERLDGKDKDSILWVKGGFCWTEFCRDRLSNKILLSRRDCIEICCRDGFCGDERRNIRCL